jgi:hypothetical protein
MSAAVLEAAISRKSKGCAVVVNLNALETYCLDEWIEKHEEPRPSRAGAIVRLMRIGLSDHPGQ